MTHILPKKTSAVLGTFALSTIVHFLSSDPDVHHANIISPPSAVCEAKFVANCDSKIVRPDPPLKSVLDKIKNDKELRKRWERDEENWRKLPARAWPERQPAVSEESELRKGVSIVCSSPTSSTCMDLKFHLATCLVFNNLETEEGLELYKENARNGHADSSTAAGIVLVEGFDRGNVDLETGSSYIKHAAEKDNLQGIFELGTLYYTGAASPFVEEDEEKALELFENAASRGHTCSEFMLADMLIERGVQLGRAADLLYRAGEKGHRFSRQQIIAILEDRHETIKASS